LAPIPTAPTPLTMPGLPFFHDGIPTQGVAIRLQTCRACVADEQGFQRECRRRTREGRGLVACVWGSCCVGMDMLDDAHRERLGIQPIERMLALVTATIFYTGLPAFHAPTASVGTARVAVTHRVTSPRSSLHLSGSLFT